MWHQDGEDHKQEQAIADATVPSSEELTPAEPSATSEPTENTGETTEVQAEPAPADVPAPVEAVSAPDPLREHNDWKAHLTRYHNDMNGLLAAKENLKLVFVNLNARQSFYNKWRSESNQTFRLTVLLRHRLNGTKKQAS